MTRRSLGISLLLLVHNAVSAAPEAHVPLRQIGPYVLVDGVYVNGHGPLRFLLDTGAESCALAPRVAERIGIVPAWRVELTRSARPSTIELVEAAAAQTIRLGSVERTNVEVLLGSAMSEIHRLSTEIDGVLGQSFLRGLDAYTIDNRRRTLLLNVAPTPRGKAVDLDFDRERPSIHLRVGGKLRRVVLDSGAPEVILVGSDQGLLPTHRYSSVHVDNRARYVILNPQK